MEKDKLHEGHRDKLRNRFIQDHGFENFEDHQILELLLFYANARKDTNPIAHQLLDTFAGMKGVLEARPEQLMTVPGVGSQAATLISMVVPLTRVWHRCAMAELSPSAVLWKSQAVTASASSPASLTVCPMMEHSEGTNSSTV